MVSDFREREICNRRMRLDILPNRIILNRRTHPFLADKTHCRDHDPGFPPLRSAAATTNPSTRMADQ